MLSIDLQTRLCDWRTHQLWHGHWMIACLFLTISIIELNLCRGCLFFYRVTIIEMNLVFISVWLYPHNGRLTAIAGNFYHLCITELQGQLLDKRQLWTRGQRRSWFVSQRGIAFFDKIQFTMKMCLSIVLTCHEVLLNWCRRLIEGLLKGYQRVVKELSELLYLIFIHFLTEFAVIFTNFYLFLFTCSSFSVPLCCSFLCLDVFFGYRWKLCPLIW